MDPNYVRSLRNLLTQSASNDTATLKAATAALNIDFYTSPACIPAFSQIITDSPEEPIRQLAAVELRKRILHKSSTLWANLPQDQREQIKSDLLNLIVREQNQLVRHSTALVIIAIASYEIPLQEWPKLLPFLQTTMASPVAAQREIGIFILHNVLEEVMDTLELNRTIPQFSQLFAQLMNDPESLQVRITTCQAMGFVAFYIDGENKDAIRRFRSLLPQLMNVIGQCLDNGDSSGTSTLMDVYETLLVLETPLLSQHIPDLVRFLLERGGNRNYDSDLRVSVLSGLAWTVEYKKSKLQNQGLATVILQGLMPITTEPGPEDTNEGAPSRSALEIIDKLATALPPTQVFPPLQTLIQQYLQSPDANLRRGAMLALGVSVEGCSEYMTPIMEHVWPVIQAGLTDLDAGMRQATCIALSSLCEWMEGECVSKHEILIPVLIQLLDDPVTQRSACATFDSLLQIMEDSINQYLPVVMERFVGLLDTAPTSAKLDIISAIGSVAHASGENFLPYFQATVDHLKPNLFLTPEGEEIGLRGVTMDALGTFAEAVGKDVFRPLFSDMMKHAFAGIATGSSRLKECSFLFFDVMARVFEEDFAPYLPDVVPVLMESLKQDEKVQEETVSDVTEAFAPRSTPATGVTVDIFEEIDTDKVLREANSLMCLEKDVAAETLGGLFESTGNHFLPYVEDCTVELVSQLTHYYEGIRKTSLKSLLAIIRTMYESGDPPGWQTGLENTPPLDQTVKTLIGYVLPPLFDLFETEDNRQVACGLCAALAETLNTVGPAFIETKTNEICKLAATILEQKAVCQHDPDQDEFEEVPEETAEYDTALISSAGDLVAALSTTYGAAFTPVFQTFYPLIAEYYNKNRSAGDRTAAIGTLSEIITGMKSEITPTTEPLLELFCQALSDEESDVQSNAAFGIGLLVEHTQKDLSPQYLHLLSALRPLFEVPPNSPASKWRAHDNAVGAVSRLIIRNSAAVPLDQALSVLINALPLSHDPLENQPAFKAIFHLFGTNPQALHPYSEKLLEVIQATLEPSVPDQINDETRAGLVELIEELNKEAPETVQAAGLGPFVPGA